jgi:hypothetical protein
MNNNKTNCCCTTGQLKYSRRKHSSSSNISKEFTVKMVSNYTQGYGTFSNKLRAEER